MGRTSSVFAYKIRFFFGPSLRGRLGPLAYFGLVLLFIPSGFGLGVGLGTGLAAMDDAAGVNLLAAPLATLLSIGLLYSLGAGVTAHASEFDFFLTSDIRPRQYLLADLMFQFISVFAAGGLATVRAGLALLSAPPRSASSSSRSSPRSPSRSPRSPSRSRPSRSRRAPSPAWRSARSG